MIQLTVFNKLSLQPPLVPWTAKLFCNITLALLAMILWMLPPTAAQAATGSINVDLTYAAAGIGYQTGTASVTLGNESARYRVKGFQFLGGGVSEFIGVGTVTGARSLNDLNGDFSVTRGSISAVVGGVSMSLRNESGVIIELSGKTTGIDVSAGPGKLTFTRTDSMRHVRNQRRDVAMPRHVSAGVFSGNTAMISSSQKSGGHTGFMPGLDKYLPHIGLYAYTMSHARASNPPDLLGGPIRVGLVKKNTGTHWILPGPRAVDPVVFGTPAHPAGWEQAPFPLIGMQPGWLRSENGRYTIVDHATPFSDWKASGVGSVRMKLVDATAIDGARTKDKVDFDATFKSPDDKFIYRVVVKKALPHGKGYPFFGGVVTNHLMHGGTAIGTRLMPTEFVYAGFWGIGKIYRNGKLVNDGQIVHMMIGEQVRDGKHELQFDGGVDPHGVTMHLMVPPYKATPHGPVLAPVKTGYAPFPAIKKLMMAKMKMLEASKTMTAAEKKAAKKRMMEVKALMAHTREKMVQAMMEGNKFFGQPFLHVMFGMRRSDLRIGH